MTKPVPTLSTALGSDEEAPDSQIRPIRTLALTIRVSDALMGPARSAYLTLMLPDGTVLFEDAMPETGVLAVKVAAPPGTTQVKAHVDAGSKYRHATFDVGANGEATHTFA